MARQDSPQFTDVKEIKKKTYLWAKQRETHRLCLYTPLDPSISLISRQRVTMVGISQLEPVFQILIKKTQKDKKHTCGPNNVSRVVWACLHLAGPSKGLFSCQRVAFVRISQGEPVILRLKVVNKIKVKKIFNKITCGPNDASRIVWAHVPFTDLISV